MQCLVENPPEVIQEICKTIEVSFKVRCLNWNGTIVRFRFKDGGISLCLWVDGVISSRMKKYIWPKK